MEASRFEARMTNVAIPAIHVTNVTASVAGATSRAWVGGSSPSLPSTFEITTT